MEKQPVRAVIFRKIMARIGAHSPTDAKGKPTKRNSQTVLNSTGQPTLRWTGNRKSAAEQAEKSLTGSMGFAGKEAAVEKMRELGYEPAFRKAYPDEAEPISPANYGRAIEAYERTLTTPAAFDKFLAGGKEALSTAQKAGLDKFIDIGCGRLPLRAAARRRFFADFWRSEGVLDCHRVRKGRSGAIRRYPEGR